MSDSRKPETDNIMQAIRKNNLREVERHLAENPGCVSQPIKGMSPLHLAVSTPASNREILDALIKASAGVNLKDSNGNTPLHLAAINKNKSAITFLIQHGADIDITNSKGQTPAERVSSLAGYEDIATLITYDAIEEARGEVGQEYKEVTDEEFDEIMGIVAEHEKYAEEQELENLLSAAQDAEEIKEAERKHNPISQWLSTFDRTKLEKICNDLGFPKQDFPELHLILISNEDEIRARHQQTPITMGKLSHYLEQIYVATDARALNRALRKIGIHESNMPEGQFDLLLDANKERMSGFVNEAKELIDKGYKETEQQEKIAKETTTQINAKEYLDKIQSLVAILPSTSGTKKIYNKILNNSSMSDLEKVETIMEKAGDRLKVVEKQKSSLFRNIDDSKNIHRALSTIDSKQPYALSSFKEKADGLIQQKTEREQTTLKSLEDTGFYNPPRRKI